MMDYSGVVAEIWSHDKGLTATAGTVLFAARAGAASDVEHTTRKDHAGISRCGQYSNRRDVGSFWSYSVLTSVQRLGPFHLHNPDWHVARV
jgi:hypothetical protein